jgi:hypothetical protein
MEDVFLRMAFSRLAENRRYAILNHLATGRMLLNLKRRLKQN